MPVGFKAKTPLSPRVGQDREQGRYHLGLEEELCECMADLRRNEMMFNLEVEPDLIEQLIYERCALQSRYRYLLGEARRLGLHTVLRPWPEA